MLISWKIDKKLLFPRVLGIHYKYEFVVRDKITVQKQLLSLNRRQE